MAFALAASAMHTSDTPRKYSIEISPRAWTELANLPVGLYREVRERLHRASTELAAGETRLLVGEVTLLVRVTPERHVLCVVSLMRASRHPPPGPPTVQNTET